MEMAKEFRELKEAMLGIGRSRSGDIFRKFLEDQYLNGPLPEFDSDREAFMWWGEQRLAMDILNMMKEMESYE